MQNFIKNVLIDTLKKEKKLDHITFIPSSKRAAIFIKKILKEELPQNKFFPKIKSIEEFVEEISRITVIDSVEILFQFYTVYSENTDPKNREPFEQFIKWANIILSDFNEIDRYLINPEKLFNYLSDIKRIENWFTDKDETILSKNYINYFKNIKKYYQVLNKRLIIQNKGYQGTAYKKALENIDKFIFDNKENKFIFLGLNALNKAEENIIQKLLNEGLSSIYFDLDGYLMDNNKSYARFINQYRKTWQYYNHNPFKFISTNFIEDKNIEIIGVPKNVSQIKEATNIIKRITKEQDSNLINTSLILANEALLPVALNSLPKSVKNVNITMGYPLKHIATSNLFKEILQLYKNKIKLNQTDFYYKDVINILSNKSIQTIYKKHNIEINKVISEKILKTNKVFISTTELKDLINNPEIKKLHQLVFTNKTDYDTILKNNIEIIQLLKTASDNILSVEYLNRIHEIFNQIATFNSQYKFINDINTLLSFYNELVTTQNLFFKGEPLDGLQIMGMLETRNLDFENVIITSVNEGFLPSGKSTSSFIPFDVKVELGLPTYTEKDAIFSYHFFRLLQRAKNIYLLYNTETDEFGASEKSRFLLQLEQLSAHITNHKITHKIISPISSLKLNEPISIKKNKEIFKKMDAYNKDKGFSPSALTNYIANPIYFYQQRVLGIKETDTIEETVALNTLGNIIHEVLEDFYKPLKKKILVVEDLLLLKNKIHSKTKYYFEKNFNNGNYEQGKNLLIFEIAKQYISNFLDNEINSVKQGNEIIILEVEKELKTKINIGDKTINLRGYADRIEKFNGITRIIDYKTGKVTQTDINKIDWEESRDKFKKYSKRFQLYFYAYCYLKENKINLETTPIESGIISFKNLKEKFLKVDNTIITNEALNDFKSELKWLLQEIYNPNIPFTENTNPPY